MQFAVRRSARFSDRRAEQLGPTHHSNHWLEVVGAFQIIAQGGLRRLRIRREVKIRVPMRLRVKALVDGAV